MNILRAIGKALVLTFLLGGADVQSAHATQSVLTGRLADEACGREDTIRQLRPKVSQELDRRVHSFDGDAVARFTEGTFVTIENFISNEEMKINRDGLFCSADYIFHNEFETATSRITYTVDGASSGSGDAYVNVVDVSGAADAVNRIVSERYIENNTDSQNEQVQSDSVDASNGGENFVYNSADPNRFPPPQQASSTSSATKSSGESFSIHKIVAIILASLAFVVVMCLLVVKISEYSARKYNYNVVLNPVNVLHVLAFLIPLFASVFYDMGVDGMNLSILWWSVALFGIAMIVNIFNTSLLFGVMVTFVQPVGILVAIFFYKMLANLVRQVRADTQPRASDYN